MDLEELESMMADIAPRNASVRGGRRRSERVLWGLDLESGEGLGEIGMHIWTPSAMGLVSYCVDCGTEIAWVSERCIQCAAIERGLKKRQGTGGDGVLRRKTPHVYPHGTRGRYMFSRCRCVGCRAANAHWIRVHKYKKAAGLAGMVDSSAARQHVLHLLAFGMSKSAIARAGGVSHKTVFALFDGWSGCGPPKTIRQAVSSALLGVEDCWVEPPRDKERKA